MTISFGQITNLSRLPGSRVEINASKAISGIGAITYRALILGQKVASGTGAVNTLLNVNNVDEVKTLAGLGSQMSDIFKHFINNNDKIDTSIVLLAEGTTEAEKDITITGTATESGKLDYYVAGIRQTTLVTSGDSAAVVAAAIKVTIDTNPDNLYTTAVLSGVVTLTAKNKGEWTEKLKVQFNRFGPENGGTEKTPAGLTVVVSDEQAGAGNIDITTALAAVPSKTYDFILMPYNDSVNEAALKAHIVANQDGNIQHEGHGFNSFKETVPNSITHGNLNNSEFITTMYAGLNPVSPEHAFTAAYMGQASKRSMQHPGKPWTGLILNGLIGDEPGKDADDDENNDLLFNGIATHLVADNGEVSILRGITNFQTNSVPAPDVSFLDSMTSLTLSYMRKTWNSTIYPKFEGFMLANDGTTASANTDVVTPSVIKGEAVSLLRIWADNAIIEDFETARDSLVVERDSGDVNRVNVEMSPDIINQFRQLATVIKFIL